MSLFKKRIKNGSNLGKSMAKPSPPILEKQANQSVTTELSVSNDNNIFGEINAPKVETPKFVLKKQFQDEEKKEQIIENNNEI